MRPWVILNSLVILFIPDLYSQSWDIIKPGTLYHSEKSGSGYIESTTLVVSLYGGPVDTVYFLNAIVEDIDTSYYYVRGILRFDPAYIQTRPEKT